MCIHEGNSFLIDEARILPALPLKIGESFSNSLTGRSGISILPFWHWIYLGIAFRVSDDCPYIDDYQDNEYR